MLNMVFMILHVGIAWSSSCSFLSVVMLSRLLLVAAILAFRYQNSELVNGYDPDSCLKLFGAIVYAYFSTLVVSGSTLCFVIESAYVDFPEKDVLWLPAVNSSIMAYHIFRGAFLIVLEDSFLREK
ncbi:D-alanyl-D-alanine carboxypeptidase [Bienertia sinuspersici]